MCSWVSHAGRRTADPLGDRSYAWEVGTPVPTFRKLRSSIRAEGNPVVGAPFYSVPGRPDLATDGQCLALHSTHGEALRGS